MTGAMPAVMRKKAPWHPTSASSSVLPIRDKTHHWVVEQQDQADNALLLPSTNIRKLLILFRAQRWPKNLTGSQRLKVLLLAEKFLTLQIIELQFHQTLREANLTALPGPIL